MKPAVFDEEAARNYAQAPVRNVPGYAGLLRMTTQLLAERVPSAGRVLVLGAGGGLELQAFATAHAGWRFDGVDPSPEMLALATRTLGAHAARVQLHRGTIEVAPDGPFDGATCLLTFHFIPRAQRLETLRQLRRRLRPGAPFVLAHLSVPEHERATWLLRHAAFGAADDADAATLEATREALATRLTVLSPEEEEAHLRDAGFTDVGLFYAGFAVRGWVARAG
ncbi:MAG: class I SAM-dependent methyltransferase [Myxococcota bacterium]